MSEQTQKNPRIYVAGHRGMVGSALCRRLDRGGARNLITRTHRELDLTNQAAVRVFFLAQRPEQVYLAAAKVGGIWANNSYPAEFIYENLMMEANIIDAAYLSGVKRLLFLGSSCIYPRLAEQPMREDALLTGTLEQTNEPYAIAKITGIKLCESYNRQYGTDFRSVMPTNLYGSGDNFDLENSHVIPALVRKFHEAKVSQAPNVQVWGTGNPRREFLHVDDMADTCVFVMGLDEKRYRQHTEAMLSHVNIGVGTDVSIHELAETVRDVIGYEGEIRYDASKPDGTPRKLLDVSRIGELGWQAKLALRDGLTQTYAWYLQNQNVVSQL